MPIVPLIVATLLAPGTYMLEGSGGNMTASIGSDGVVLVDSDFAEMAGKLQAKLEELHGSAPRVIINTHFHYDHTGGNEIFGRTATIVAATELRNRLLTEQVLWGITHPAAPSQALPTVTFERELTLHLNGESVRVVHLPHGHTDGDSVVFFSGSKAVATGDLYFAGMYPIFHPEHQGSLQGLVADLEWVLGQADPDAKIVPGHGPLSTKAELGTYLRMLKASISTVEEGIRKGWDLPRIQQAGLAAEWEPFSHGYRTTAQWLQSIYVALQPLPARR